MGFLSPRALRSLFGFLVWVLAFAGAAEAETQRFEPSFLLSELKTKGKVRTEVRLGPPEYPCDEQEVIEFKRLISCKKLIVFKRTQIKGCWGVTNEGNWEMQTPSVGYVNEHRQGMLGYADQTVRKYKSPPGTCPDLLIRVSGEEFGRVYHKTGYALFRYDSEQEGYVRKTVRKPKVAPSRKKRK